MIIAEIALFLQMTTMDAKIIYIKEVDSTNNFLRSYEPAEGESLTVVWTDFQTAGRGCGTNTWESEAGKNLTFSVLVRPSQVLAREQFILSMANAVALKRTLDAYVDDIRIKWPNDIYWCDRKICGTLIETTLRGSYIRDCIIGTGLNVNQQLFVSNAPNPVSLCQILGHEVDRDEVLQRVVTETENAMLQVEHGDWEALRATYRSALYRLGEVHSYRLPGGIVERFLMEDVEDDGHLLLRSECSGQLHRFGFKEVQFVIDNEAL